MGEIAKLVFMKIKGQQLCYSPAKTVGLQKNSNSVVFARFYIAIWWKDLGLFAFRELRGKHTNFHAYKFTPASERARNGFQITSLEELDARACFIFYLFIHLKVKKKAFPKWSQINKLFAEGTLTEYNVLIELQ